MKRTNYTLLFALSAFSVLFLNAVKEEKKPCIKGEGATVTENREIDGASRISLESSANLNITQGKDFTCSISAQQNILNNLVFDRDGDKLTIHEKECVTGNPRITIDMTIPSLTMVGLGGSGNIGIAGEFHVPSFEAGISGSGNIDVKDSIVAGSLHTKISGSGDISLKGSFKKAETRISGSGNLSISGHTNDNDISISGSGKVHAFDFRTAKTNVRSSGSGNLEVNASQALDIQIRGSGDVAYKGNPCLIKHISGSGSVNKKAGN
jgi:hypothetical protein